MASSNNNGFGNGQNGYSAEFGLYDNGYQNSQRNTVGHFPKVNLHQQQSYYPTINPNTPNPRFLNPQQHPQVYSYGLRNIVPRTDNQINQQNNFEQRYLFPPQNAQLPPARQILHSRFQHPSHHHHHYHQNQQQFSSRRYLSADPQSITVDHQHPLLPRHYLDPNSQTIAVGYTSNKSVHCPQGINQSRQIPDESPQNFQVPSITPTQNSNESDPLGAYNNNLLDLSSPQYSAVTVHQNKPLEETNDEELEKLLDECNFNPEFPMTDVFVAVNETYQTFDDPSNMLITDDQQQQQLGTHESNNVGTNDNLFMHASEEDVLPLQQQSPPTVNLPQIPLAESDMEKDDSENVEANTISAPPSSGSSSSVKNSVGRPRKYKTNKQRKEAHRNASRASYRICREREIEHFENLQAEVERKESENGNLRQRLTMLKDHFIEILNSDSGFFTPEEINWALNIFNQNSQ